MSHDEPELGKRPADKRDYRPFTWELFLALRAWAQGVAAQEQAHVYLVGSALYKSPPRDVDISVVLPRAEFERRFGPIPDPATRTPEDMGALFNKTLLAKVKHYVDAQETVNFQVHVDLKFAPDDWWTDKDRLLLAAPPA